MGEVSTPTSTELSTLADLDHAATTRVRPEVLEAMAGRRVILVLGGHYHKPVLTVHGGIPFHQLPSPKSDIPAVTVFRVTDERLVGVTWDYANSAWLDTPVLDVPLQTPAPGEAGASEEDAGPEGAAQS